MKIVGCDQRSAELHMDPGRSLARQASPWPRLRRTASSTRAVLDGANDAGPGRHRCDARATSRTPLHELLLEKFETSLSSSVLGAEWLQAAVRSANNRTDLLSPSELAGDSIRQTCCRISGLVHFVW